MARSPKRGHIRFAGRICDAVGAPEMFALASFEEYRNGILPVAGGMLDQPAWFVQAMRFLAGLFSRWESAKMEPARRQAEAARAKAASLGGGGGRPSPSAARRRSL